MCAVDGDDGDLLAGSEEGGDRDGSGVLFLERKRDELGWGIGFFWVE